MSLLDQFRQLAAVHISGKDDIREQEVELRQCADHLPRVS